MVENENVKKYKVVADVVNLEGGAEHKKDDVIELDSTLPQTEALLESGSVVLDETSDEDKSGTQAGGELTLKKYKVLKEFTDTAGATHAIDAVVELDPAGGKVEGYIADGYIAEDVEA